MIAVMDLGVVGSTPSEGSACSQLVVHMRACLRVLASVSVRLQTSVSIYMDQRVRDCEFSVVAF